MPSNRTAQGRLCLLRKIPSLVSSAVLWIGLADTLAAQSALDAATLEKLSSGEVLVSVEPDPNSSGGRARGVVEIDVAPQQLWTIMLDCKRTLKFVKRLKSCTVTSADAQGRWDVREHLVEWIWPLPKVRSVFRSEYMPFETIRFRRVEGDLKSLEGSWRLEPIKDGRATRLFYAAQVDPGVALPGVVVRNAIETELRNSLTGLRREATGRE